MPPPTIERKQGDTGPEATFQLIQDGVPANLTGATARFYAKLPGNSTLKVDEALTPINAAVGIFRYAPAVDDFDTAGKYDYEIEVTLSNGRKYSFPSSGFGSLVVSGDLNIGD
jgi:hypothetical protein